MAIIKWYEDNVCIKKIKIKEFNDKFLEERRCCLEDKNLLNDAACSNSACNCARKVMAGVLKDRMEKDFNYSQTYFVTLYSKIYCSRKEELYSLDLLKIKAFFLRKIHRMGLLIARAIGVIDIQMVYDLDGRIALWQPHIHMYFQCEGNTDKKDISSMLSKVFKTSKALSKSYYLKQVGLWPPNTEYLLKESNQMVLRLANREEGTGRFVLHRRKLLVQGRYKRELESFMGRNDVGRWVFSINGRL